jgi:GTPase SAR1 family protein
MTSLPVYLISREFKVKDHSQHTIGVEFSSRTVKLGEKRIKLQVKSGCYFLGVAFQCLKKTVSDSFGIPPDRNDFGVWLELRTVLNPCVCVDNVHRSVTRSYYRGAAGAILVYDITK